MKIVISGTYSTGKTTTTLALSLLTGIPATHARTMREILPTTFHGKRLEKCNFHELIELGIRRFTERIVAEQAMCSFVSDGCPLQEWIYGTTRIITGLNPSEKPWKNKLSKFIHSNEWRVFEETLTGFGKVVKKYTKTHYDTIIHLPVEFLFVPDGHRPTSESFRNESEKLLLKTYKELNLNIVKVSGNLKNRLENIVDQLQLKTIISIDEAINLANEIRIKNFDAVNFEVEKIEHSIHNILKIAAFY